MVGSMFRKLLKELGIQTEDAKCNLIVEMSNFAHLDLIIKVVWVGTIPRQAMDKMISQY